MENKESYGYAGRLTITLKRGGKVIRDPLTGRPRGVEGGIVLDKRVVKNTLLNTGRSYLIQRIMDDGANVVSGTAVQCITVGTTTSAGSAGAGDTTATDVEVARENLTYASGALGACSATATFVSATANGALTEAGLYAGVVGTSGDGVFFARTMFAAVNKTSNDTLQIKWDVSFTGT